MTDFFDRPANKPKLLNTSFLPDNQRFAFVLNGESMIAPQRYSHKNNL